MELLVVIAIIGLLSAVVLVSLGTAKGKGTDAGKIRAVAEVRNALNVYFNDFAGGNGSYPSGNLAALKLKLEPKYISLVNPSIIYNSSTGSTYHLGVVLAADNKVLTTDSDTNDGVIDGTTSNCLPAGALLELCYDVTP